MSLFAFRIKCIALALTTQMVITPAAQFECAVPEVRRENKKIVYDIILKRAGMSWLAVSKRYSECRRFHSRLLTSEVVTQCAPGVVYCIS